MGTVVLGKDANMGRKTNAAVTAGLVAVLSLGQMPTSAIAESLGLDAAQTVTPSAATDVATAASENTKNDATQGEQSSGPTVESVPSQIKVSCTQGEIADLPQAVAVAMSDGTSRELPVTWSLKGQTSAVDTAALAAGTYELTGAFANTDKTATVVLVVNASAVAAAPAAEQSISASLEGETTPAGTTINDGDTVTLGGYAYTYHAPNIVRPQGTAEGASSQLSESMNLGSGDYWDRTGFTDQSGNRVYCSVDWDFSQIDTSKPGTYTVPGTVTGILPWNNLSYKITATYTVKTVRKVEPKYDAFTFVSGQLTQDGLMGRMVSVTFDDGTTMDRMISFTSEDVEKMVAKANEPGVYQLTGTIVGSTVTADMTIRIVRITSIREVTVHTQPGQAPQLPTYVMCTLESNRDQSAQVQWDQIDPSQYAEKGSFKVLGTVPGTNIKAVATIYVSKIVSVESGFIRSGIAGYRNTLSGVFGDTIPVHYELGGTDMARVTWDVPEDSDECWNKPGVITVTGNVEGTDLKATGEIILFGRDEFNLTPALRIMTGETPYIYAEATRGWRTERFEVDWDKTSYDPSAVNKPGTFTMTGKIQGTYIPITATVTVVGIDHIEDLGTITTPEGIAPALDEYPNMVTVTYTDGTTGRLGVDWSRANVVPAELTAGKTVKVTAYVYGKDIPVSINVKAIWTMPYKGDVSAATAPGVAPRLPQTVVGTLANGTTKQIGVDWETVDPSQYANAGAIFTVNGTLKGSNYKVTATVKVLSVVSNEQSECYVAPGVSPALGYPSLILEDGTALQYDYSEVMWDTPNPSDYEKAGSSFVATGKLAGTNVTFECKVSVRNVVSVSIPDYQLQYLISDDDIYNPDYLPREATVTLDNGQVLTQPVAWDYPADMFTKLGTKILTGYVGTHSFEKAFSVLRVMDAKPIDHVRVLLGGGGLTEGNQQRQTLDMEVTVDDGSGEYSTVIDKGCSVITNLGPSDAQKAGTFETTGTAHVGNGVTVECPVQVDVVSDIKDCVLQDVWTQPGIAPVLPEGAAIYPDEDYSIDDALYCRINWDSIDPSQYAEDKANTSFTVKGRFEGTDHEVEIKVTVADVVSIDMPTSVSVAAGSNYIPTPEYATVTLTDGSKFQEGSGTSWKLIDGLSVDWLCKVPGTMFRMSNILTLPNGTSRTMVCTVNVLGAAEVLGEKDLGYLSTLTTEVGVMPSLPETVPVKLSDGSISQAPVVWDPISYDDIDKAGKVEVTGYVQGVSEPSQASTFSLFSLFPRAKEPGTVTAKIHVVERGETPQVSYFEPQYFTMSAGGAVDLGSYAPGVTSRGEQDYYTGIVWDTSKVGKEPGTYVVTGTLKGTSAKATAYVTVVKASPVVTSVHSVGDITVKVGADKTDIAKLLPAHIGVTYADGTTGLADVAWIAESLMDEDLFKSKTIELEGNVDGASDTVKAKVTIKIVADTTGIITPIGVETAYLGEVTTKVGTAPVLPKTASVKMSNGGTQASDVTWETISEGRYGKGMGGTSFTVKGVTEIGNFPVTATVKVEKGEDPEPEPEPKPTPQVTGIKVTTSKTDAYTVGDEFDASVLKVTKKMSDGTEVVAETSDYTVAGFDSSRPGQVTVYVTMEVDGKTFIDTVVVTVAKPDATGEPEYVKGSELGFPTVKQGVTKEDLLKQMPANQLVVLDTGEERVSAIEWNITDGVLAALANGTDDAGITVYGKTKLGGFDVSVVLKVTKAGTSTDPQTKPEEKPSGKVDQDENKGGIEKNDKGAKTQAKLAQTGDASAAAVAATGAAGVASLVGAWFTRRRKRDE